MKEADALRRSGERKPRTSILRRTGDDILNPFTTRSEPLSTNATLNRYKLIGGPIKTEDVTAPPLTGEDGKPLFKKDGSPRYPVRWFNAPEIVVSAEDLTVKHVNKFVYAGPYGTVAAPLPPSHPAATPTPVPPPSRFVRADLEAMTVADLRKLAEEEEIDLGTASVKAEIVTRILLAAK